MSELSRQFHIEKACSSGKRQTTDYVAVEEPLEIQVSSAAATGAAAKSISITMRTPGHDAELALGFLFTEGIIKSTDDVVSTKHVGQPEVSSGLQNILRVEMSDAVDLKLDRLERHFYTTSSCGVCGKASLDALRVEGQKSLTKIGTAFTSDILLRVPELVRTRQPVFSATGGLHAAAIFGSDGEISIVREDVGRHNATDKVIGKLLQKDIALGKNLGLFVSGRASFELIQKTLVAGIPLLAAVGAPSSLAVEAAKEFGMTLVGFLRDGDFNIYAGQERIK